MSPQKLHADRLTGGLDTVLEPTNTLVRVVNYHCGFFAGQVCKEQRLLHTVQAAAFIHPAFIDSILHFAINLDVTATTRMLAGMPDFSPVADPRHKIRCCRRPRSTWTCQQVQEALTPYFP